MSDLRVPYSDLTRQESAIRNAIDAAILDVARSPSHIYSPIVDAFEEELTHYCGVRYAITVASGTDALTLALIAAGIGSGDEVITTTFSFYSTAGAIRLVGATPVFVDVDSHTFTLDINQLADKITSKTRAILPVHLYGQMAEMNAILELGDRHGLIVVEDAAQAIGATYSGIMAGSMGRLGCLSFNYNKNLGAYGNGGAILTNDSRLADELTILRNYGLKGYFQHSRVGFNSRLSAIQSAVLREKLKMLDEWNYIRNQIAKDYNRLLAGIDGLSTPVAAQDRIHVYHKYTIIAEWRDELQQALADRGVQSQVFYPIPLHLQQCFSTLPSVGERLPISEYLAKHVLSLPLYPGLTDSEIHYVAESIREFYDKVANRDSRQASR